MDIWKERREVEKVAFVSPGIDILPMCTAFSATNNQET